jgi:hypothetical protein
VKVKVTMAGMNSKVIDDKTDSLMPHKGRDWIQLTKFQENWEVPGCDFYDVCEQTRVLKTTRY